MERPDVDDVDPLIAGLVAGEEARLRRAVTTAFGVRLYRTALGIACAAARRPKT